MKLRTPAAGGSPRAGAPAVALLVGTLAVLTARAGALDLFIKTDAGAVGMGRSVVVTVSVSDPAPLAVWPYVNGTQWGSYATCMSTCQLILPLVHAGTALVQLAVLDNAPPPVAPHFTVGTLMPITVLAMSNPVEVQVTSRSIVPPQGPSPALLVGMEWEPWFTPHNSDFSIGEGVPLIGWCGRAATVCCRRRDPPPPAGTTPSTTTL